MNSTYTGDVLRFFALIAAQVLILNHINLGGYIDPMVYVLFILLLPFEIPGWALLITAFLLGYGVDSFSNSTGLHAAASVFMAFARPFVIRLVGAPAEYEGNLKPGIAHMGFKWFLAYASLLVFVHHLALFLLEAFRFAEFGMVLLRTVLSSIFTIVLIIITVYLFMPRKK